MLTGRRGPLGRRPECKRITPVPLLLTGVRLHPPGRTDKNLCRCFGAPARRVFPDHLITRYLPALTSLAALAETNNEPACQASHARQGKLGSTDADGKWQLGSPTAANDEKTQTVTGYKRRAPTAAADAPDNASNLQAAVQHNADKEKEKSVEANLWTRVSSPCPKWRRRGLLLPSHVQAPARPVAQHQNSGEKEKTQCPGTCVLASRHRAL